MQARIDALERLVTQKDVNCANVCNKFMPQTSEKSWANPVSGGQMASAAGDKLSAGMSVADMVRAAAEEHTAQMDEWVMCRDGSTMFNPYTKMYYDPITLQYANEAGQRYTVDPVTNEWVSVPTPVEAIVCLCVHLHPLQVFSPRSKSSSRAKSTTRQVQIENERALMEQSTSMVVCEDDNEAVIADIVSKMVDQITAAVGDDKPTESHPQLTLLDTEDRYRPTTSTWPSINGNIPQLTKLPAANEPIVVDLSDSSDGEKDDDECIIVDSDESPAKQQRASLTVRMSAAPWQQRLATIAPTEPFNPIADDSSDGDGDDDAPVAYSDGENDTEEAMAAKRARMEECEFHLLPAACQSCPLSVEQSKYPPCIRAMVGKTNVLHVVTIMGATIGRSTDCDVCLPDFTEVSRSDIHHDFVSQSI